MPVKLVGPEFVALMGVATNGMSMLFALYAMLHVYVAGEVNNTWMQQGLLEVHDDFQRSSCNPKSVSTIKNMTDCASMRTIFIIYDDNTDTCMWEVIKSISYARQVQIFHERDLRHNMEHFLLKDTKGGSIEYMRSHLNFVLFCTPACIRRSMKVGHELDIQFGTNSTLRHFSQWLISTRDVSICQLLPEGVVFDNVALITHNQTSERPKLYTLLWKTHGREWSELVVDNTSAACPALFPNQLNGLNGRRIKIAALEWQPFSVKLKDSAEPYFTGISGEILDYLSRKLNFTYLYVEPPDLLWGNVLPNGSWTGIVGMLQKEEVDLCSVPYAFNPERAKVMSFTYPILLSYTAAVYKQYEDKDKVWKSLISCFKSEVYIVGAAVLFGVACVYLFLHWFPIDTLKHPPMAELLQRVTAVPLGQAISGNSGYSSGRMLFSFWCLFCLVMTSTYRGNLIAFLAVEKTIVPFRTVSDLANQDMFDIGTHRGSFISLTLEMSNLTSYQNLWKKAKATHAKSPEDYAGNDAYLLRRLDEGGLVLLVTNEVADLLQNKDSNLQRLKEEFMNSRSSMVFPLHSPLANLFYEEILTSVENGLYERWYTAWAPPPTTSNSSVLGIGVSPLGIQEYYSALVACGAGVFSAMVVLLLEIASKQCKVVSRKSLGR